MTEVPMREPTFLILTALAAGAQHGYGIMTDVAQISGGRVRLRAGTLYAALNRLAVEGLVEVDREEIVDARLRRYYRLTPPGTQRLRAEVDRMRRHATVAARRLALPGSPACRAGRTMKAYQLWMIASGFRTPTGTTPRCCCAITSPRAASPPGHWMSG